MRLSARNQIRGTISEVKEGAVNGIVAITFGDHTIKADITNEAIESLGLKVGEKATALTKASSVMVATGSEPIKTLSARNQFPGTITQVLLGAVNGHVIIDLGGGNEITASITNEAIESLGLKEGAPAVAIVKATNVIVGVD